MTSPLDPVDDFGHDHAVIDLLLAVDAVGARVDGLAAAADTTAGPAVPDDFVHALAGLSALRRRVQATARGER